MSEEDEEKFENVEVFWMCEQPCFYWNSIHSTIQYKRNGTKNNRKLFLIRCELQKHKISAK